MMANKSCNHTTNDNNNGNSIDSSSSIIAITTSPGSPWKKLSETANIQAALPMGSVIDASSWPALSSKGVPSSSGVIIPESSSVSVATSEIAAVNENANGSSATNDSMVSVSVDSNPSMVSVSVSVPIDLSAEKLISSSSSSSNPSRANHSRPVQNQSSRQSSYGHNQNHQHYPSGRSGSNQRGNSFNSKGGNRGGGDGFQNQNRRHHHQQQRGFNNWSHNRGAHSRMVNSHNHHGFGNSPSGFLRPPPLPHSFPHSAPIVNPPYVNVNVNQAPVPGFYLPYGYYGNPYISEASNPLYGPPAPPVPLPSPPPPPPPPYMDARSGTLTYSGPISGNPDVGLCNSILHQIEYYFSKENLVKDAYLKSLMDNEGWVPVHVIAGFRRVKAITSDSTLIVRALQPSAVVEVQGDKVRKRGDWMNWVPYCSPAAQISSVTDISTSIQNIQLGESARADALIGNDLNCLHAQMNGSDAR